MQLRHTCSLPGEAYVARSAWREASLDRCPRHPRGGCGLVRHGTKLLTPTTPAGAPAPGLPLRQLDEDF